MRIRGILSAVFLCLIRLVVGFYLAFFKVIKIGPFLDLIFMCFILSFFLVKEIVVFFKRLLLDQ